MKKFNKLSEHEKNKLMFNQWIMYINFDLKDEENDLYKLADSYYNNYRDFRFHCIDIICENDMLHSDIPRVDEYNQNMIYKKCRSNLNLKLFKGNFESTRDERFYNE